MVLVPGRAVWMVLEERTKKHHALVVLQRVSEECLLEVLPKAIRGFRLLEFSARRGDLKGQSRDISRRRAGSCTPLFFCASILGSMANREAFEVRIKI
jgi:hypothetical protein